MSTNTSNNNASAPVSSSGRRPKQTKQATQEDVQALREAMDNAKQEQAEAKEKMDAAETAIKTAKRNTDTYEMRLRHALKDKDDYQKARNNCQVILDEAKKQLDTARNSVKPDEDDAQATLQQHLSEWKSALSEWKLAQSKWESAQSWSKKIDESLDKAMKAEREAIQAHKRTSQAYKRAKEESARCEKQYQLEVARLELLGEHVPDLQVSEDLQEKWKEVLDEQEEEAKLLPLTAEQEHIRRASPLRDMVADYTEFTKKLFPKAAAKAAKITQAFCPHILATIEKEKKDRSLPTQKQTDSAQEQTDSAQEQTDPTQDQTDPLLTEEKKTGLPTSFVELDKRLVDFQSALKALRSKHDEKYPDLKHGQMQIEDAMLKAWLKTERGHFANARLSKEEPERYLENVIIGALPRLIDLVGLQLKSGEVYSQSHILGNPQPETGRRTGIFLDMLAVDKRNREFFAHETSERKDGDQKKQFPHALEDRRKLARQAISALHVPQSTSPTTPSCIYLTQLHREDKTARTLVLSYMCCKLFNGLPVLFDVLRVPVDSFLLGGPPSERQQAQLLGACLQITLNFARQYCDPGVAAPAHFFQKELSPVKKRKQKKQKRPAGDVAAAMGRLTLLSINEEEDPEEEKKEEQGKKKKKKKKKRKKEKKKKDEDPPEPADSGAGAGGNTDTPSTSDERSGNEDPHPTTGSTTGSTVRHRVLRNGKQCAICLRDDWGGREVKTLLGPSVERVLSGFDTTRPDYVSGFSHVFVGRRGGPNADFVLKLHNTDCGNLFDRERTALRLLSGVRGVPAVEAVVVVPGTGGGIVTRLLEPYPWQDVADDAAAFEELVDWLVTVLSEAHARGVAHCDLKDTAVMRRPISRGGDLVLNDWNLSHMGDADLKGDIVGTPQFALTLWRPPSPFALDCVALAVLLGWACEAADVGVLEVSGTYEDTLDRVCSLRRHWKTEPPVEAWHAKALLLVHLLLVSCDQPLQVTYQQWYYGCWVAEVDAPSALALGRLAAARTQQCRKTLVITFMDHIRELNLQRQQLQKQEERAARQPKGPEAKRPLVRSSVPQTTVGGTVRPAPASPSCVHKCVTAHGASAQQGTHDVNGGSRLGAEDTENQDPQLMA